MKSCKFDTLEQIRKKGLSVCPDKLKTEQALSKKDQEPLCL